MSTQRVTYFYELMDAGYESHHIGEQSRDLGHVPIVHPKAPGGPKSRAQAIPMDKPKRQLSWAEQERYKERTMVERVNARLKDEFGGRNVRVRGAAKVAAHLMFGVLALTAAASGEVAAKYFFKASIGKNSEKRAPIACMAESKRPNRSP